MKTKHQEQLLEKALRDICTYHSDDGTSGYNLSEKQFEDVLSLLLTSVAEARKDTAEDICVMIDEIESLSETNTLEEWKQYKHIRNAIRDKYVLSDLKQTKGEERK